MSNLLIVGAGGHGHCCYEIAERMNVFKKISFLDDNETDDKVIGKINQLEMFINEYDSVCIAMGNNSLRKELLCIAKKLGYKLPSLIDPVSFVSKYCFVDEGSVVFPNSVLETQCFVGRGCIISSNTTIHHNARVEEFSLIYSNTVIRPEVKVGSQSRVGSNSTVLFGVKLKDKSDVPDGTLVDMNWDMTLKGEEKQCIETV